MPRLPIAFLAGLALAGCNDSSTQPANQQKIRVTSTEQQQLHQLDAINLAIGLKRAIYDAGYTCKRVTDAGFVGTWKNNDMWTAHCVYIRAGNRQLAPAEAIPECTIKQRPKGNFNELK